MKLSIVFKLYLRQNIPLNTTYTFNLGIFRDKVQEPSKNNLKCRSKRQKNNTNEFIRLFNYHKTQEALPQIHIPQMHFKTTNKHEISTVEPFPLHECGLVNTSPFLGFGQIVTSFIHAELLIKSCSSRFLYSNILPTVHHSMSKTHVTSGYRRRWEPQASVAVTDLQNSELILEQLKGFGVQQMLRLHAKCIFGI